MKRWTSYLPEVSIFLLQLLYVAATILEDLGSVKVPDWLLSTEVLMFLSFAQMGLLLYKGEKKDKKICTGD